MSAQAQMHHGFLLTANVQNLRRLIRHTAISPPTPEPA
jgi:hypothetical protein